MMTDVYELVLVLAPLSKSKEEAYIKRVYKNVTQKKTTPVVGTKCPSFSLFSMLRQKIPTLTLTMVSFLLLFSVN